MLSTALIAENIRRIEERIHAACLRSGRDAAEVKLMAVSKTHPAEAIASGFAAGLRLFGENRVQEFQQKLLDLSSLGVRVAGVAETSGEAAAVHLIGHLQSNKTGRAGGGFSGGGTGGSLKLGERRGEG